jgi:outer membrane lipoprotein-sorting protein
MRALRSVRMTGRITFRGQSPRPFEVELARPGKIRTRVTFPAGAWIQVWDGKDGWTISPFAGDREPAPMTAEQRRNAPEQADLEGSLVDPEKKGLRLTFEGKVVVDGKDAWRIRVTRPDGVVRYVDIDAATSLKLRWEGELGEGENRKMNASLFSDYRTVGGYAFPFRIVSGVLGGPSAQEIAFDRVEVDPAIPDSDFERPR